MHFRKYSQCTIIKNNTVKVVYEEHKKGPSQFKQITF